MEPIQKTDLRDALAAERTFLAWIRTGLALMGFGFVVAPFWTLPQTVLTGSAGRAQCRLTICLSGLGQR